jgi:hypothetical protein
MAEDLLTGGNTDELDRVEAGNRYPGLCRTLSGLDRKATNYFRCDLGDTEGLLSITPYDKMVEGGYDDGFIAELMVCNESLLKVSFVRDIEGRLVAGRGIEEEHLSTLNRLVPLTQKIEGDFPSICAQVAEMVNIVAVMEDMTMFTLGENKLAGRVHEILDSLDLETRITTHPVLIELMRNGSRANGSMVSCDGKDWNVSAGSMGPTSSLTFTEIDGNGRMMTFAIYNDPEDPEEFFVNKGGEGSKLGREEMDGEDFVSFLDGISNIRKGMNYWRS